MTEKADSNEFQLKNVGNQYIAAATANLLSLGHGAIVGWVSPALATLTHDSTPLKTGPLTNEQVSWIGSINTIGGVCGAFITGYLASVIGCKRSMLFLAVPSIVFWTLIHFGDTYYHILVARAISGYSGGGIMATLVLYVSEISDDRIRGRLGSLALLIRNIGTLTIFVAGAYVDYIYLPRIFVTIYVVFLIAFSLIPNTPRFYLRKQKYQEAERALKYYKGFTGGKSNDEMNGINKEFDRLKSLDDERKINKKFQPSDLCEKQALRGLIIGMMITIITQFMGTFVYVSYGVLIFEKTGSSMDPYRSSIVIAVMQLVGNLCTTQLADTLGRKFLIIVSLIGSAMGNFSIALYMYLQINGHDLSAYPWIPVASISFVMFIASAGILSLYNLYIVESLPTKVRGPGLVICNLILNIANFICLKFFPILIEIIGLHGCLTVFGISCSMGAMYVLLVLEETKGISMDAPIQQ